VRIWPLAIANHEIKGEFGASDVAKPNCPGQVGSMLWKIGDH